MSKPTKQLNKQVVGKDRPSQYIFEFVRFLTEGIKVQENSCIVRMLIHLNNIMVLILNIETL